MEIQIKDFNTKEEVMSGFPIIRQLYTKMDEKSYEKNIDEMMSGNNYHMIGVYFQGKLIAVSSYWVLTRFYCGKYIQIGNMVVDGNVRSKGIGEKLLKYIEEKGRDLGCEKFILDSYTENKKSHKLYFNEGFFVEGLHFMKEI
jgi:GNAT superfamily N-acetyltransferase